MPLKDISDLHIAEIGALRSEVNSNIERSANNENFCSGACAALIAFAFSREQFDTLAFLTMALCVLILIFGIARHQIIGKHTVIVDKYLEKIENNFSSDGGWAAWYRLNEPKSFASYKVTRIAF